MERLLSWRSKDGVKDKTFIMTQSGHIAGIVNPPSKNKYGHYTNDDLTLDHDDWLEGRQFPRGVVVAALGEMAV